MSKSTVIALILVVIVLFIFRFGMAKDKKKSGKDFLKKLLPAFIISFIVVLLANMLHMY